MLFTILCTTSSSGATINTKAVNISDLEGEFHVYGIEWSINAIDFYVDGELNYTYAPGTNNPHIGPLINPFTCC